MTVSPMCRKCHRKLRKATFIYSTISSECFPDYTESHSSGLVKLVLFLGITSVGTGIWACLQGIDPFYLEGGYFPYKFPGKLLLFSGALLIATSVITILQTVTLTRVVTICLMRALSVVILLESVAGSAAVAMTNTVTNEIFNKNLKRDLVERYSKELSVTLTVDDIQRTLLCCGVEGRRDWLESHWYAEKSNKHMRYPPSCCGGNIHCHGKRAYTKGCGREATDVLYKRLWWTYLCSFVSVFIHVTSYLVLSFLESRV